MAIEDQIPKMTDKELENLHANAARLAQGPASKRQAEAERLLPLITEALAAARTARATEAAEKKVARQKDMADARAKKAALKKKDSAPLAEE